MRWAPVCKLLQVSHHLSGIIFLVRAVQQQSEDCLINLGYCESRRDRVFACLVALCHNLFSLHCGEERTIRLLWVPTGVIQHQSDVNEAFISGSNHP